MKPEYQRPVVGQEISRPVSSKKTPHKRRVLVVLAVIAVMVIIGVVYLASSTKQAAVSQQDASVDGVISAVSKHYVLPTDEKPALATVTDRAKLNSSLAKRAENGDRILIYQNSRQAIVYRPSVDRVVDVTQVQIDEPTTKSNTQ